jgi:lipoprotein-anchoring transpeptidase ErfK/SrfK
MRATVLPVVLLIVLGAAACARPKISIPIPEVSPDDVATFSLDSSVWRMAADRDRLRRSPAPVPAPRSTPRVGTHAEPLASTVATVRYLDFDDITADAVNAPPNREMLRYDRGPAIVRAQVLLDRANFSVGAISGRTGKTTQIAIYWFQYSQRLLPTGVLDPDTYNRLVSVAGTDHVVTEFTVDKESLKGPFVVIPHNVYEQARLRCLCYSSPLEELAERFHATAELLQKLNPKTKFASLAAGDKILVPSVERTPDPFQKPVARIHISKSGNYVQALAADGSIVLHFPSTLGSMYDPSPDGSFEVTAVVRNPTFRYDPTLFSDVPDSKPKAKLPPGPNSPVGTVWIALSKEHVGIHGTPTPETIGLASSHGCVRLTNWDAEKLADAMSPHIPVEFVL